MNTSRANENFRGSQETLQQKDNVINVIISKDSVLNEAHPSYFLFSRKRLAVSQKLEVKNVLFNWDQANRYSLRDNNGNEIGLIEEKSGSGISRNALRTHRGFEAYILNLDGKIILKMHRPFHLITSSIFITTENDVPIGHVEQKFTVVKRKYKLFDAKGRQFASINAPPLSWEFTLKNEEGKPLGCIDRNFSKFTHEVFTNKGSYAIHFDASQGQDLTLDERAVAMACAISIDFDYFSEDRDGGFLLGAMSRTRKKSDS
ncbi:hypothetical protein HMI55_006639 [Coelomomyces lativittatus]|nr:hypothetical protein HMI56_003455 [Coelomomyces lativittatus]KAJ1511318.1 hypothetical protein HMI55_006639 [Coelomomyces lativittatus]